MSVQFNSSSTPLNIPGLEAGYTHQYDDVDGEHAIHAMKHIESGEMVFVDDAGARYEALGDGVFQLTQAAPEQPEEPDAPYVVPEPAPVTLETIEQLDGPTLTLIGFMLAGQINTKVRSYTMRYFNRVAKHRALNHIDGANDALAEMEAATAGKEFFSNAGQEVETAEEEQDFLRDQMRRWLAVRVAFCNACDNAGVKNPIETLPEAFMWSVGNAGRKVARTEAELEIEATATGGKLETFKKTNLARIARAEGQALEDIKAAYPLLLNEEPLFETPEPDFSWATGKQENLLAEVFLASIQNARKSRPNGYGTHDEVMSDLLYLRALEETVE